MSASLTSQTLLNRWEEIEAKGGANGAIWAPSGEVLRSYTGIELEAQILAGQLAAFAPGSVLGVQIGNSPSWPAVVLALFRCGLIPLPLGRHMQSEELALALDCCQVAGLITATDSNLEISVRPGATPICWKGPLPDLLKLTSGTTSAPRAVRFRADQLLADSENICQSMGLRPEDRNFGVIPFSHSYGFSNLITPLLSRGIGLVASEDRMPRAILEGLAASRATVFPGMPIFFQKLAELSAARELPHLRLCISAGAMLPVAVLNKFHLKFNRKIHTFYGASECGGIGYDRSEELMEEEGFVGTQFAGVELEWENEEGVGRITVRGPAVGDGYFPEPEEAVLGSGRFVPSDLMERTTRGLKIVGRTSELIHVAGRKLNPLEVEHRLLQCPGVEQVIVFGVASVLRGEEPVACVVGKVEAAEVLKYCQAHLSAWQTPKDVWLLKELPANERGKISRRLLGQQYLAAMNGR